MTSSPGPTRGPLAGPGASARLAEANDVGRLVVLWQDAVAELAALRGGRVLLGLMERGSPSQSRPAAVAASFARQLGDPGQLVVVGALDGRAVGYGTCSTLGVPGEELIGSVSELYVELASRRKGVGRAMAASVLEWCQAAGCNGVDALALPGSRATKSFFEAEGFVARLLVMHRPLPAAGPGQGPSERSQAPR